MCGRFTLHTPVETLVEQFELVGLDAAGSTGDPAHLPPRYNIAPTQPVLIVRQQEQGRVASLVRWGLVPPWASRSGARQMNLINARAESAAEKPAFRSAFKHRRCLVLADGFYEWQQTGGNQRKQPSYFRVHTGQAFAMAGLWEQTEQDGGLLETCTILTTAANAVLAPVHHRMPVILSPAVYAQWLDPALHERDPLQRMLLPYPAEAMQSYPVGRRVGNTRNDDPQCMAPLETTTAENLSLPL